MDKLRVILFIALFYLCSKFYTTCWPVVLPLDGAVTQADILSQQLYLQLDG